MLFLLEHILQKNMDLKEHDLKWMKLTYMDTTPSCLAPFTSSATEPLRKHYCFFFQKDDGQDLFTVRIENAGKELQQAVKISQNPVLMKHLNNAISPSDAHAIDV